MIQLIENLLENNRQWVQERLNENPAFFDAMAQGQHPAILWIGCSDSRVPPNEVTKTQPGEMFVHRNIANLVVQTDMNMLSVLQYAVEVLKVQHIIVCGHYGCGGIKAALTSHQYGLIDNWLRQIKDTINFYWDGLKDLDETTRENRVVELNVVEQIYNLGKTSIIQNSWKQSGAPYLHGWVFDVKTGLISTHTPLINTNDGIDAICKYTASQITPKVAASAKAIW
jgi:carbonic anhydrase